MKEGLDEVVGPDLSDHCFQTSESKSFQYLALDLCLIAKERVTNARVQEEGCFWSPTPRRFRQSAVESNRLFYLDFWVIFP